MKLLETGDRDSRCNTGDLDDRVKKCLECNCPFESPFFGKSVLSEVLVHNMNDPIKALKHPAYSQDWYGGVPFVVESGFPDTPPMLPMCVLGACLVPLLVMHAQIHGV